MVNWRTSLAVGDQVHWEDLYNALTGYYTVEQIKGEVLVLGSKTGVQVTANRDEVT